MKIVLFDHPLIRQKLQPVTRIDNDLRALIANMRKTVLAEQDPEGVGLAANQVAIDKRLYVAKIGKAFVAFINPEIVAYSRQGIDHFEGCLSIPDMFGFVRRSKEVTVKYTNENGKTVSKTFRGLPAIIMQHELDHLNGILFIDHVAMQTQELFRYTGTNDKGEPQFEKIMLKEDSKKKKTAAKAAK